MLDWNWIFFLLVYLLVRPALVKEELQSSWHVARGRGAAEFLTCRWRVDFAIHSSCGCHMASATAPQRIVALVSRWWYIDDTSRAREASTYREFTGNYLNLLDWKLRYYIEIAYAGLKVKIRSVCVFVRQTCSRWGSAEFVSLSLVRTLNALGTTWIH